MTSIPKDSLKWVQWCHAEEPLGSGMAATSWVSNMAGRSPFADPVLIARESGPAGDGAGYAVCCEGSIAVLGSVRVVSHGSVVPQFNRRDERPASTQGPDAPGRTEIIARIVQRLREQAGERGVELFQAIQALPESGRVDQALASGYAMGGLKRVARLLQMESLANEPPPAAEPQPTAERSAAVAVNHSAALPLEVRPHLEYRPHHAMDWADWCRLVERTYIESLDVPELIGLRRIDSTLLGYARGQSAPARRWWSVWLQGAPVGCVILTPMFESDCELTYLGLVQEARGKGYSSDMMRFILGWMHRQHRDRLVLAVDERNRPAVATYLKFGFHVTMSLDAWLARPLSPGGGSSDEPVIQGVG
jgi:RimJ/RimL family protein N-acetyltransferase